MLPSNDGLSRFLRSAVILFSVSSIVVLVGGCASLGGRASPTSAAAVCDSLNLPERSFLGLYKPEGAKFAYQDYAEQTYLLAQMADNAYPREAPWVLPDTIRAVRSMDDADGTGFAATVFEVGRTGALSSVVIAFRGTEGAFLVGRDWRNGNIGRSQQRQAEALYREVREAYPTPVPIVATGHSLGGALALQVSLTDTVSAYVFNSSYRVIRRSPYPPSYRLSLAETGEAAWLVRWLLPNLTLWHLPGFDCTVGNPFKNHGITAFARCLTRIAAAREQGARESLQRNRVNCPAAVTLKSPRGDGATALLPSPGDHRPTLHASGR
jgi:hypothetical protein